MSVAGKYVLASNENYGPWLAALGIPAEVIPKVEAAKPQMEITQNDNQVTLKTISGDKDFSNTITLGQDSKFSLPRGFEYTLNLNLSGSTLSGTFEMKGNNGTATIEFTDAGFTETLTCCGMTAKRVFARM